jgi:hypothetical protein
MLANYYSARLGKWAQFWLAFSTINVNVLLLKYNTHLEILPSVIGERNRISFSFGLPLYHHLGLVIVIDLCDLTRLAIIFRLRARGNETALMHTYGATRLTCQHLMTSALIRNNHTGKFHWRYQTLLIISVLTIFLCIFRNIRTQLWRQFQMNKIIGKIYRKGELNFGSSSSSRLLSASSNVARPIASVNVWPINGSRLSAGLHKPRNYI